MATGARNKFSDTMFGPEVFREQMCCTEERFLGLSGARVIVHPLPPSVRLCAAVFPVKLFVCIAFSDTTNKPNSNCRLHRYRSKKIFGGAKDFCPKSCHANFADRFWCGPVFTCFSANVGRHFCSDSHGCCRDIWGFCPDFQRFCPNFQQIKTFGGVHLRPRLLHQ